MLNHALITLAASATSGDSTLRMNEFPHAGTAAERWSRTLLFSTIDAVTLCIFCALGLCLWRMIKGPTVVDRGIAADTFSLQVVALAILLCVRMSTLISFDIVLIVAILGFASTLAFAQYVGRKGTVA